MKETLAFVVVFMAPLATWMLLVLAILRFLLFIGFQETNNVRFMSCMLGAFILVPMAILASAIAEGES